MKSPARHLMNLIVTAAFCSVSAMALAMPKAAEDDNAEIGRGVDAARPKHSSAKPAPLASQAKPAKKPTKSAKKAKPAATRKK